MEPIDTPIEINHGLSVYLDQILMNNEIYRRLVGNLIYLAHTRPDLSYVVSVVSQFMYNLSDQRMNAVNRILAYLKSSPDKDIMFSKHGHLDINGDINFDFVESRLDRKFTSRYVSFVGGNLVTWRSKNQNVVSLSSEEVEYHVFHHATMERTWLRILLRELRFDPKKPMVLFCNNTTTIEIANNPIQHKDNLDFGMIKVPYIKSID